MSTSDEEFERLLRAARRAEKPSDRDRATVWNALSATLVLSAATPSLAGAAKLGVWLVKSSMVLNVALPLVAGAALGAGFSTTVRALSTPRIESSVAAMGEQRSTPSNANPTSQPALVASSAADARKSEAPPTTAKVPPRTALGKTERRASVFERKPQGPPPALDPLEFESRGIAQVQRALRDGDAARALRLLDTEDRLHPGGALVEERAAARIFALCSLGKATEAQYAAAEFVERFPRSPLRDRVRSSCAGRSASKP